jgi:hypothetical protein
VTLHSHIWSRQITKIVEAVVVKQGLGLSNFLDEVALMQFVKDNTTIPVPEVLSLHYTEEDECYLFMSLVEGYNPSSTWRSMPVEGKCDITSQLVGYISQLHQLEPPQPVTFGSLVSRTSRDTR